MPCTINEIIKSGDFNKTGVIMTNSRLSKYIIVLVASIMVLSTVAGFTLSLGDNPVHVSNTGDSNYIPGDITNAINNTSGEILNEQALISLIRAANIPSEYAYLPNLNENPIFSGSTVIPKYNATPAPMGIADYGLMNQGGKLTPYQYSTSGFKASLSLNSLSALYMLNGAPDSVAFQLSAVLNNVAVKGKNGKGYWTQNIALYTISTHQIQFISNIWNLSSPAMAMTTSSLLTGNGHIVPVAFYYYAGPEIQLPSGSVLNLYLSSGVYNSNSVVYFNYSVDNNPASNYDMVQFKSIYNNPPVPLFLVSGSKVTPSNKLLNDVEFVITGPGSGSTTSVYNMSADSSLMYYNSTSGKYANIPSAYDFGSNTGETVTGVAEYWTQDGVSHVGEGPSILYGMWNASAIGNIGPAAQGYTSYQGTITPGNSFLFISRGSTFIDYNSSWAPLSRSGSYNYHLPPGAYTFNISLSNYQSTQFTPSTSGGKFSVDLIHDMSAGIYTPLYAYSNIQLSNLSVAGNGTISNPYIIANNQYFSIDSKFARFNDYMFPVFAGVLISGTDSYANFNNMPSMKIEYPANMQGMLANHNLPSFNFMNFEFYNTSNISVYGAQQISGWFYNSLDGIPAAGMMFWNSTNSLIADNVFSSMGNSLLIYNDNSTYSNNTVWGNTFNQNPITYSQYYPSINITAQPVGLSLYSSDNTIYNNYFSVELTAYSPHVDVYSGMAYSYANMWNISRQPAGTVHYVNGYPLYGSIIKGNYQGGNYWWDYTGSGSEPYNASGGISSGWDFVPLVYPSYNVVFSQTGLGSGLSWSVELDGRSPVQSTFGSITFKLINGSYTFTILKPDSYSANPVEGIIHVYGGDVQQNIVFSQVIYTVTFRQSGLSPGVSWAVNLDGQEKTSTTSTMTFTETNGTYEFTVSGPTYYSANPSKDRVLVYGSDTSQLITFTSDKYMITFKQTGLPAGMEWSVSIHGVLLKSTTDTITFMDINGSHPYLVGSPDGYVAQPSSGTAFVYGSNITQVITFTKEIHAVTFSQTGLPSGTGWSVNLSGTIINGNTSSIAFSVPNGVYNYTISKVGGYSLTPVNGTLTVNGSAVNIPVAFSKISNPWYTVGTIAASLVAGIVIGGLLVFYLYRRPERPFPPREE